MYSIATGNDLWICMEFCNVGSLAHVLSREPKGLEEHIIRAILVQLVKGLAYLHERQLIHRDVVITCCCCFVFVFGFS
jgi:serine/threonine protein kinase